MKKKYIYIMVSQTGTGCSKILQFFTRAPYNHASIAFDENLNSLYSFARQNLYIPLIAGFVKENINEGIYKIHDNTICQIYRVPITNKQLKKLQKEVEEFEKNGNKYHYNFLGLVAMLFNIPYTRPYHYVCSQFVAYVLEQADAVKFDKHFSLIRPYDFCDILDSSDVDLIYSGKLADYNGVFA